MAFLPRVKNAITPAANKNVRQRDRDTARRIHLEKLAIMRPSIDNTWGAKYNGVREYKNHYYDHVAHNLKRAQLQEERLAEINVCPHLPTDGADKRPARICLRS